MNYAHIKRWMIIASGAAMLGSAATAFAVTDTTPPTVGNISPGSTTAWTNVAKTYTATYSDDISGVNSCKFQRLVGGAWSDLGTMTLSGELSGTATISYAFTAPGSYTTRARCTDAAANVGQSVTASSVTVTTDSTSPTVGNITPSPTTAWTNIAKTYSATYSDGGSGVNSCKFQRLVGGAWSDLGTMTIGSGASGTATISYAFTAPGSYTTRARCTDAAANVGQSVTASTVTVTTDSTDPTVGAITPTTATAGTAVTLSATVSDADSGIAFCDLLVNAVNVGTMTVSGGSASRSHTFSAAGSYTVYATCQDNAGNTKNSSNVTVTVSEAGDTTPPTVGTIPDTSATVGISIVLSATYSDNVGVTSCKLIIDGASQGVMTLTGAQATKSHTFTTSGNHTAQVECSDAVGNSGMSPERTIAVAAAGGSDTTPPTVSVPSPPTAIVGSAVTISATVSDNVGVTSCSLFVNGVNQGSMTVSGGSASRSTTFSAEGAYSMYVQCSDAAGNTAAGATGSLSASAAASGPAPGSLIKLSCPTGAAPDHPCKAVYYYGSDGKRHAFTNDKVYFTWYVDFSSVQIVSSSFLSSLPLGKNVVYRPGVKMVKFQTLAKVYAVSRRGELRWVTSESAAVSLYGSDWNRQIDDISDAFFLDYSFGADINSSADFNRSAETAAVTSIDANL